jgi:hypothetical protein
MPHFGCAVQAAAAAYSTLLDAPIMDWAPYRRSTAGTGELNQNAALAGLLVSDS